MQILVSMGWVSLFAPVSSMTHHEEKIDVKKENHRRFRKQLQRTHRGFLRGDDLGEWCGPPKARWEGPYSA